MKPILITSLALALSVRTAEVLALAPLGCLIEPSQIAQVGSQVVGVTESVNVERGDVVYKGQILATLKSDYERANVDIAKTRSQLEADVRSAEANLELARITEKRGVDLVQKKFLSQQALDKSHAETQLAEQRLVQAQEQLRISGGELNVARAQLGLRSIRAPFDGIVAERFIWPGERVEDKPLFKIVKIKPLRVEIVAPVELYGQVEKDQTIQIKPDLAKTASVDAKVVLVDKVIDGASNTFRIRAEIDNQNAEIPSGLRCKATISPNNTKDVSVSKALNGAPKVSDSPVALKSPTNSKHSFELKPLAEAVKPEPKDVATNLSGLGMLNKPSSQQQQAQQQKSSEKNKFSLNMDKSASATSSQPSANSNSIKVPSDKKTIEMNPAISIEEQYKQLQLQRDALKSGSYKAIKPTSIKSKDALANDLKTVAYHPASSSHSQDDGKGKDGIAYPAALAPQVMRQVTPLPVGMRRITFRDGHKTFPIRRVVVLEPNAPSAETMTALSQNQNDTNVNASASAIKVSADWQSNIVPKNDLSLKPKLRMEKTLFVLGDYSNQSSSTSN